MQLIIAFTLFFTALVNAAQNHAAHGQRFHHRRALNASDLDANPITTMTVVVTTVRTVLGCPATKTDCPVATHPISLVTDTVAVYTTVCPLSVAQSISASISSSAATSGAMASYPVVVVPAVTGAKVAQSAMSSSSQSTMTETTLTYVLGTGTTKTTITTTMKLYRTETDYVTKYITMPSPSATISGATSLMQQQAAVSAPTPAGGSSMEPTTTITSTSTTTKTVTIIGVAPGASSSGKPVNNSPLNSTPAMKAATATITNTAVAAPTVNLNAGIAVTPLFGACAQPVTVTVTVAAAAAAAASTVTVTLSTLTVALSTLTVTYTEMGAATTPINLVATAAAISTKVNPAPCSSSPKLGSNRPVTAVSPMSSPVVPHRNGTVATQVKPSCLSSTFLTQGRAASTGKTFGTEAYYGQETGSVQSKESSSKTAMAAPTGYY